MAANEEVSNITENPRPLNLNDKHFSLDERLILAELSNGLPLHTGPKHADKSNHLVVQVDCPNSPSRRSSINTPKSLNAIESHPMMAEAWEALKRSLVHFRGVPVGTIAALDSSEENLNYDQVSICISN